MHDHTYHYLCRKSTTSIRYLAARITSCKHVIHCCPSAFSYPHFLYYSTNHTEQRWQWAPATAWCYVGGEDVLTTTKRICHCLKTAACRLFALIKWHKRAAMLLGTQQLGSCRIHRNTVSHKKNSVFSKMFSLRWKRLVWYLVCEKINDLSFII